MRQKQTEMETIVAEWLEALSKRIKELWDSKQVERAKFGRQKARLIIGQHATKLSVKREALGGNFTSDHLEIPQTKLLARSFRERAHHVAWPIIFDLRIHHDRYWDVVEIEEVGIAGALPRSRSAYAGGKNIDQIIEVSQIIGALCPPTNRPVRAWSTQDNIIGAEHVHILGIHARTEAEVVLKKLFNMFGIERLREIRDGKPIAEGEWLTRIRFVATDLEQS